MQLLLLLLGRPTHPGRTFWDCHSGFYRPDDALPVKMVCMCVIILTG